MNSYLRLPTLLLLLLLAPGSGADVEVCRDQLEGLPFEVAPPRPPSGYDPPTTNVINVTTTEELQLALAWNPVTNATPMDIVLADGVYSPVGLDGDFLVLHGGHRLWARNSGQAVLQFGIHIGHNSNAELAGAELHGLYFDIVDETHGAVANPTFRSFAVLIWGTAHSVRIEDCIFDGGTVIDIGIGAYRSDGLIARRIEIQNFKRFGIYTAREEDFPFARPAILEDFRVSSVGDNDWALSFPLLDPDFDPAYPNYDPQDPYNEAEEVGIMIGAPARLSRAYVRDIARVGIIAAGRSFGVVMEDLDVDDIGWRPTGPSAVNGAGLYFDSRAYHSTYRRFCVGPNVVKGLVSEWDNDTFPRGVRNHVQDGLVEASWVGIFYDQGTVDSTVDNVYFRNASWAGLTIHNNTWPGDDASSIDVLYSNIHDVGLPIGSCLVTAYHPNNAIPCHTPPPNPQNP